MDAMAALLDGPRARGAFLLRSSMDPPWALRIEDEAPLTLVAVVRGEAWILPDRGEAIRVMRGDVAIVRGPGSYRVADDPATAPQAVIHADQRCTTPDGQPVRMAAQGVRTWGNSPNGATVMLTGTYGLEGAVGQRLLRALPALVIQRAGGGAGAGDGDAPRAPAADGAAPESPLVALLADEVGRERPGQEAVLDRLLDLLLIATLRDWFARPESGAPSWFRAYDDPVVGPAVRLLYEEPARPWTVAALADAIGVSRATLARRFAEVVGEPPMGFLTEWRIALAADLLCEPGETIASVAQRVGYGSAFALSAAFKRVRGMSPQEHRAATAAARAA